MSQDPESNEFKRASLLISGIVAATIFIVLGLLFEAATGLTFVAGVIAAIGVAIGTAVLTALASSWLR